MTRDEAYAQGYMIDEGQRPMAYKGPRFAPLYTAYVPTKREEELLAHVERLREYARAVEHAAYKAAIEACTPHEDDDALDCQAKRECIDAIRSLMEQPK